MPKRVKYKRHHRGRLKGYLTSNKLIFGNFGLQARSAGWITAKQIEAARRTLSRVIRRNGKLWIRIFPDKPVTERATESRMGAGKGSVENWVAIVKFSTYIFEIIGLEIAISYNILKLASQKLPLQRVIIQRF